MKRLHAFYVNLLLSFAIIFVGHTVVYGETETVETEQNTEQTIESQPEQQEAVPEEDKLSELDEVRYLLENYYVEELPEDVLEKNSVEEIINELDMYSDYFSKEEYEDFRSSIEMNYTGIGVVIAQVDRGMLLVNVIERSPAEASGLEIGDVIVAADGNTLEGLSIQESAALIKGVPGTEVSIDVYRPSTEKTFTADVERKKIEMPTVDSMKLGNNIGYLSLHSFNTNSADEMKRSIEELGNVKGWIVDVRNNGGGYLEAAQDVVGLFPDADVAVIVETGKQEATVYKATKQDVQMKKPIILLVNGNSASASEILAGAVKDQDAAQVYGQTTFGKGTVQVMFELDSGGVVKITNARFYSPDHNEINKVGIEPDVETPEGMALQAAHRDLILKDKNVQPFEAKEVEWDKYPFTIRLKQSYPLADLEKKIHLYNLGGEELEFDLYPVSFTEVKVVPKTPLIETEDYLLTVAANEKTYTLQAKASKNVTTTAQSFLSGFSDVKANQYFAGPVQVLYGEGIINGVGNHKFAPYHYLTRQDAAIMFARALKLDTENIVDPGFKDVKKDAYYYNAVAAVKAAGIFNGVEDDEFGTDKVVTREEMAALIARAFELENKDDEAPPFLDVSESAFKDEIATIYYSGITTGNSQTSFAPNKVVTRAQFATFLYRAMNNVQEHGELVIEGMK